MIERDDTPMPDSPDEAFEWDRRGAPQVRHSHAFLARIVNLLRTIIPTCSRPCSTRVPPRCVSATTSPRRWRVSSPKPATTSCDARVSAHDVRVGIAPHRARRGQRHDAHRRRCRRPPRLGSRRGRPRGSAVQLDDGTDLAPIWWWRTGGAAPWPTGCGVGARPVTETVEDTGIVYASRFYRLLPEPSSRPRPGRSAATSATSSTARSSATTGRSRSRSPCPPTPTNSAAAC